MFNRGQNQKNKQELVQDLNYSYGILMMTMSSVESLFNEVMGQKNYYQQKKFGSYDKFNYSYKNINELRSQLSTHLMIMRNSLKEFNKVNGGKFEWDFPPNYSRDQFMNDINIFGNGFKEKGDKDSFDLVNDLYRIVVEKNDSSLTIDKKNFDVQYSKEQQAQFNKNVVKDGMLAG